MLRSPHYYHAGQAGRQLSAMLSTFTSSSFDPPISADCSWCQKKGKGKDVVYTLPSPFLVLLLLWKGGM